MRIHMKSLMGRFPAAFTVICLTAMSVIPVTTPLVTGLSAKDWPEWRGEGRRGIWPETGILDTFPAEGLKSTWRVPIGGGYSGPAVAKGRVFVTDFVSQQGTRG